MGTNVRHGHVTPRADGAKARCGGPAICSVCAREQAEKEGQIVERSTVSVERPDRRAVSTTRSTDDGYVPTLLQYAEVIVWLDEQARADPIPEYLKRAYDDAVQRESLDRVAKAMEVGDLG